MTDFQVLPPGLNAVPYNRISVDSKDFQIKRELLKKLVMPVFIYSHIFLSSVTARAC